MKGNIFFCGDLHGKFSYLIAAVLLHKPDAVVLLGDIMGDYAERSLDQELAAILDKTEIWWIHGNHDTDQAQPYELLFASSLADRNLHGRVVEVAGIRIAGLGGVFRGRIWFPPEAPLFQSFDDYFEQAEHKRPRRLRQTKTQAKLQSCQQSSGFSMATTQEITEWSHNEDRKHCSSIFPAEYERLLMERADVLVTHEAPGCHPHGYAALTELAQALGVQASFHGHQHDNLDYSAHQVRLGFEAHGVGLRGISDLSGKVIVAGDLDHARTNRGK